MMKKIFSLLIGFVLISTGVKATEEINPATAFETAVLVKYASGLVIQAVLEDIPPNGKSCAEIQSLENFPVDYSEQNCSELSAQSNGQMTCEKVRKSIKKLSQLECRFEQKENAFVVSFSNMPADIDAFISEKMIPAMALSSGNALNYQKGSFVFNFKGKE